MTSRLLRSSLLVPALVGSLAAQAPTWQEVLISSDDGVDIRCVWQGSSAGWELVVHNFGTVMVHFNYYLDGQQDASKAHENRRVHLAADDECRLGFPVSSGTLVISEIRRGNLDEGEFWRQ